MPRQRHSGTGPRQLADTRAATTRRIRRSPEQARAEIVAAAEAALEEVGFQELTVELVMQRTGMTRSAFYHYFTGLDELALGMLEHCEADIRASQDGWLESAEAGDPEAATIAYLTAMFGVLEHHRRHVVAVAQAASTSITVYWAWQRRVVDHFVERTAAFIRHEVERGRSRREDPERVARALVSMNNAMNQYNMARDDRDSPETMGRVVGGIWNAVIYGRGVPDS